MLKAINWLKKETVIRVGADFRSIGGKDAVSPQLLNDCYCRMASWVRIAEEALKCEWPTFEAVQCFAVFQLKPRLTSSQISKDLEKICTIFDEKHQLRDLIRSFIDCEYTASKKRPLAELEKGLSLKRVNESCKFVARN